MFSENLAITHETRIGTVLDPHHRCCSFEEDTILQKILEFFASRSSDSVIITRNAMPAGILTLRDLVKVLNNCDNLGLPVREFMSSPLQTVDSDHNIGHVLDVMHNAQYDKIVAVKEDNVVGVIDRRHLLAMCYTQIRPMITHEQTVIHSLIGMMEEGEKGLLKMATTDSLTGLGNRRLFEEVYDAYQKTLHRNEYSLFLLVFDIDNFKSINDTFGHNVGDSVLRELADVVGHSIRKSDTFVRWGGEEFAILQRYSDPAAVMKVAEQIRKKIDAHSFETIVHVTASFGLTQVKPGESLASAFERADKALYRAKDEGKNRVRVENP